jgi:hypothetical protein
VAKKRGRKSKKDPFLPKMVKRRINGKWTEVLVMPKGMAYNALTHYYPKGSTRLF